MLTVKGWVLRFLALDDFKPIEGATRLQKLMFLASQKIKQLEGFPKFEPGPYGPFSSEIEEALKELKKEGLVEETTRLGGLKEHARVFSLTENGKKVAKTILEKVLKQNSKVLKELEDLKKDWNNVPLLLFLMHVYNLYPEYAKRSIIKSRIPRP